MSDHGPKTPSRPRTNLVIPVLSPVSRRSSPRAEDVLRKPRKAECTRKRLEQYHTFDAAVDLLKCSNNIVVLTGAGISTSVGIPDFRSDHGLYNQLSKIGITQAEEFFSKQFFIDEPEKFFKYVRRVVPGAVPLPDGTYKNIDPLKNTAQVRSHAVPEFTPTHAFLAMLQAKKKLLTNYTQNIDGLERAAGLSTDRFVQCHGSWDTATCLSCQKSSSSKRYLPVVLSGNVPYCKCSLTPEPPKPRQRKRAKSKPGQKRKRAQSFSDHSSDDNTGPPEPPRGLLKPDITFFEENITSLYHSRLEADRPKIDLLIIIGTSLKVDPVKKMLFEVDPNVPQIYLSKERFNGALCSLPGVQVDIELLGECDIVVEELCSRAGWSHDLQQWLWHPSLTRVKGFTGQYTDGNSKDMLGEPSRSPIKRIRSEASIVSQYQSDEVNMSLPEASKSKAGLAGNTHIPRIDSADQISQDLSENIRSVNLRYTNSRIDPTDPQTPRAPPTSGPIIVHTLPTPTETKTTFTFDPDVDITDATSSSTIAKPEQKTNMPTDLASKTSSGVKVEEQHRQQGEQETQAPSKVKIELVLGTTHQWRVTRLS